jgi:hypothetical protein
MTTTVAELSIKLNKPLYIQIISQNNLLYAETEGSIESLIEYNGLRGKIHTSYIHAENGNFTTVVEVSEYFVEYGQETIDAINKSNDRFVQMFFPPEHPYKYNGKKYKTHNVMIIDKPPSPSVPAKSSAKANTKKPIISTTLPISRLYLNAATKNISQTETLSVTTDVSTISSVETVMSYKEEAEKTEAELVETNKKAKTLEARLNRLKKIESLNEELKEELKKLYL